MVLFPGIAQGIQRSISGVAMILGPLWGGALIRRLYLMLGVMAALEVILAVSGKDFLDKCFSSMSYLGRHATVFLKNCCIMVESGFYPTYVACHSWT